MFAEPVRLGVRGGLLPAELQQLLFSLTSPDFQVDVAAIGAAEAALVHAGCLDVAPLADTRLIVFAGEDEVERFETMPHVIAAIEWPADPRTIQRSLALAARWMKRERQLRLLASTDPLTGLLNRRGFEERARRCIDRARAEADAAAVLLIDLDHFKRVNDSHGHAAGDAVLRHVGQLLTQLTRPNDIVGRLGGEELAIVLADVTEPVARETAERLRQAIADTVIPFDNRQLRITTSIGIALSDAVGDYDLLLQDADDALYEAKARGRNRVVGSDELIAPDPSPARPAADERRATRSASPAVVPSV